MMKKGKGYLSHVKNTDKSIGDPYKQNLTGDYQLRAGLNKWEPDSVWEWPTPIKATKQNHKGGKLA
jgi:hypothetical protein